MADEIESSQEESTGDLTSLVDDVFKDPEPEVEETAETETKGETEAAVTEQVTETKEVESPSTNEDDGLNHPALLGERRRRQEAEEKLREAEAKLRDKETKKAPDPIEDPDGYAAHVESRAQQNEFKTRIAISRDLMKDANPDFEEVEKVFMTLVADAEGNIVDESLFRKFQAAPNPARFAYHTAKEHLTIQEMKSPTYRDRLRAEVRAEIEAEMKGNKKGVSATQVPDLVKSTASGSNSTPVEKLPEMDEIFADSKL